MTQMKTKSVVPAQAGIHAVSHVPLCYGFPPAQQ